MSARHQSQLHPTENKFHVGNGADAKHYWLTPPDLYARLDAEFHFTTDVCPWLGRPWREGDWDGLTDDWGPRNYGNIPFGSIMHQGVKKGPTAWFRKAIAERRKGNLSVIVYPVDKWLLMVTREILGEHADIRNLGDVRWCATEDGSQGKGTGRHIACFVFRPPLATRQRRSEMEDEREACADYIETLAVFFEHGATGPGERTYSVREIGAMVREWAQSLRTAQYQYGRLVPSPRERPQRTEEK